MDPFLTLVSVPAILAMVQLAKNVGLPTGKWAALLAVGLGILLKALEYGVNTPATTVQGWLSAVAAGLLLGLGAAGVYDAAATVGWKTGEAQAELKPTLDPTNAEPEDTLPTEAEQL